MQVLPQLASWASAPHLPPPSAEETPGACRALHCIWTGSQAQSFCLQIQADLVGPQPPGGGGQSKVAEEMTTGSCPPLENGREDHFPLSKPDATAHFSTRSSLLPTGILQCLKAGLSISQNWNLSLAGFALKKGKVSLRSRRWHATARATLQYAHKRFQNVSA